MTAQRVLHMPAMYGSTVCGRIAANVQCVQIDAPSSLVTCKNCHRGRNVVFMREIK